MAAGMVEVLSGRKRDVNKATSDHYDPRDPYGKSTAEFKQIDKNNDGVLTVDELFEGLRSRYSQDEIKDMKQTMDTDQDGVIRLDEYHDFCYKRASPRT